MNTIFLGVKRHVIALSKDTGTIIWKTHLAGGGVGDGFVSLATDGARVFAHTSGEAYCLDVSSGKILWKNDLPGLGYGMASICASVGPSDSQATLHAHRIASENSAAAAAATAS